ncbi:MAG: rhomboid family intramembrane serine protease [Bacteroidaceae bacterium]|nr:rhomboid family intramembrane serine protease [Bacteroidaceae bacterium]
MVRMFKDYCLRYLSGGIVNKFIFANVALYILLLFIGVFSTLFNVGTFADHILSFLELPASLQQLLFRPWTLLTYMFVHAGVWHLLWNMIALFLFGKIFLEFFSARQFAGVYILGGLAGALFYVIAYNLFPYFSPVLAYSRMVGASAAVFAIVVATAVRSPEYRINMLLIGSVRLSTLALVTVAISFIMLTGDNAGGNFAHLGGAFAGWLFAYMLGKGTDIISLVVRPFESFASFLKRPGSKRKAKFTYVKGGRNADYEYNARKKADEAEVDRILEKIKKGGYASLSEEEKKRLFEASSK